jgi:protein-S-isoprenylcysteine O-methyltransferase Ste14
MNGQLTFRIALIVLFAGYTLPRNFFQVKAHQAHIENNAGKKKWSESKLRLAMMGISGLGTHIIAFLWVINPDWFAWSSLNLPVWLRWIGIGVGVATIMMSFSVHRTLDRSYTPTLQTTEGHHLVTDGIYGWIRHPMYTTFFMLFIASFLISTNWLILALGAIYSLLIVNRVIAEETMMINVFGDQYREYIRHTGRFLPKLS